MEISFIGAGKAALSLGKYFYSKGHTIKYVFEIDKQKSDNFIQELGCKSTDLDIMINNSEIVFLTVNDNAIYPLWNQIKNNIINANTVFIHCSGAKEGIYGKQNLYALHPACAMTGDSNLSQVCFGLENNGDKVNYIKKFIENMGNRVILI